MITNISQMQNFFRLFR